MAQHNRKERTTMRWQLCVGAAALATIAPQQISAQTADAAGADPVEIDVITVTANKRTEKLTNIAGALDVQTGKDLNAQNATGLRDYIGNMPGVSLQSNGAPGFARVVIRGISGVTLNATTATYIDDVAVSAAGSRVAGGFLTPDLDPADLERVELLKGPQGALYGASGPGGLLKYVTRLPDTNNFSGGAKEELSSVRRGGTGYSLRAHTNIPIVDDVAGLRISGYYRKDPGFIDNLGIGEKNSNDLVAKGVIGNLLIKPASNLTIRIGGIVQDLQADGMNAIAVDRVTLEPILGRNKVSTTLRQGNDARFRHISGTVSYDISPDVQLVSATGYSRVANRDRTDLTPDAPLPVLRYYNVATRKFTQEIRLMSAENKVLEWMVGLYYTKERSNGSTVFQATQADGTPDDSFPLFLDFITSSRYREMAVFGNATYYFTPDFDATVGLRYSRNQAHFTERERGLLSNPANPDVFIDTKGLRQKDNTVNYLATARWRFAEDSLLYARAANAYQPGGPRSLPAGVTPPIGFTDAYGPETLWNYELGVRTSLLDRRLEINASLYYIDWKDIQGFVQIGDNFLVGATGNAGDAVSKGFEIEVNARPTRGLSFGAAVGYSKATLERSDPTFGAEVGDDLPYAPRWTVSLHGEYEQPITGDWTAFVGGNYRSMTKHFSNFESRAFLDPRGAIPFKGYGVLDVRIGARSDHFDVTLFAKNLTNKFAYIADTTATASGPAFESILQPRTIGISFSQRF